MVSPEADAEGRCHHSGSSQGLTSTGAGRRLHSFPLERQPQSFEHAPRGRSRPQPASSAGLRGPLSTHRRTATSFLKAWNCSGVGSTTFRIFTATSPANEFIVSAADLNFIFHVHLSEEEAVNPLFKNHRPKKKNHRPTQIEQILCQFLNYSSGWKKKKKRFYTTILQIPPQRP